MIRRLFWRTVLELLGVWFVLALLVTSRRAPIRLRPLPYCRPPRLRSNPTGSREWP
jgi:hypothetical protein